MRPKLNREHRLFIRDGRHPVVEQALTSGESFVPNDTDMDLGKRMMIITGPNMAGKSTYMRQVALIVLMAQIGSFVPAHEADIMPDRPHIHAHRRERTTCTAASPHSWSR